MPTVFPDCDGVLADFVAGAAQAFGMPPEEFERRDGRRPPRPLDMDRSLLSND
jgi:hypothetical protein